MTWAEAIIATLGKRPTHDWALGEIYAAIERLPIVEEHHRDPWRGQPNFHHWIRSELAKLCQKGKVRRVRRSTYRLASKERRNHEEGRGKRGAVIPTASKTRITIDLDDTILKRFKAESEKTGKGYQALINEALKAHFGLSELPVT